jgi:hypothetical protein
LALGIQALAIQWTEVTHLTILVVDNAIATAGYPSRIAAINRSVREFKNTCI